MTGADREAWRGGHGLPAAGLGRRLPTNQAGAGDESAPLHCIEGPCEASRGKIMSFARAISVLLLCGSSAANAADETLADKVGAGQVRRDAGRASEQAAGLKAASAGLRWGSDCVAQQPGFALGQRIRLIAGEAVRPPFADGSQVPESLIRLEWERVPLDESVPDAAGPSRYWIF